VLSNETVDIQFEGQPTTAKRIRVKIQVPKFVTGGSNELIVYYVAAEVRGRFVGCVLSHYSNDPLTENGVPALLAKVMKVE